MTRRDPMAGTGILLLAALLAAGCSGRPERVTIGVALSAYDHPAVEMAVEEINAGGGLDGVPLELAGLEWEVRDATDPEESFDWVEQFDADESVVAVVGHSDSPATFASAPLYNRRGIPQIVTIATHPTIDDIGDWIFRICVDDAIQGRALEDFAVLDRGWSRLAVFYVNDDYGKGIAEKFIDDALEDGAEIVSSVFHRNVPEEADRATITAVLERLRRDNPPDAFILLQRGEASRFTIREIRRLGFDSAILGSENLGHGNPQSGGMDWLEGVFVSRFFDPQEDDTRAAGFRDRYRKVHGREPGYSQAFAYDAIYLLRDAIENGGPSREGVKSYLDGIIETNTPVAGVTGTYRIVEGGDARREFYIGQIREGSFRRLKTILLSE